MPCDTGICDVLRVEQFNDVLNEIARLIQSVDPYDVVVGGDFNTDYNRHSAHITLLESLCNDEHLLNAKMHNSAQIDYTYCNYASGVTSTIDHFLLTERAHKLIVNVQVAHSGANLSDHDPLLLQMRIPHQKLKESIQRRSMNVQWNKATEYDLNAA